MTTNLKKALEQGKLEEFIAEREDQPHADREAFEDCLMPFRSADYQRGYDAGYKQALLDALKQRGAVGAGIETTATRRRALGDYQ